MKKLFAVILSLSLIIAPVPAVHAAASGGGYMNQALGIANGVVGATVLTSCKMGTMQPSILVYMAGGLIFVAAEMAGGKDQTSKIKSSSDKLDQLKATMTEGGDYQKAAIQAQLDDEKSNLAFIQKRRKWMMATKAVYATATALAIVEFILSKYPVNKPDQAACEKATGVLSPMMKGIALAYSTIASSGGTLQGAATSMATQVAASMAAKNIKLIGDLKIAEKIAEGTIKILDKSLGRVAYFAAATALVQAIDSGLAKEEKKTKQKISDLEKVRDQLSGIGTTIAEGSSTSGSSTEGANGGNTTGSGSGSGSLNNTDGRNYAITELPKVDPTLTKNCYSNASGTMEYSEASCKNSYQLTKPKYDMNMNIPTLVSGANTATELAQAIANGDSAKADVAAASLNAMAGKIDSIRDGLLANANDQLKKDGKAGIDTNSVLKSQVDEFNKELNKANPGSGNHTLASLGLDALKAGEAEVSATETGANALNGSATDITKAGTENTIDMPSADLSALSESNLAGAGNSDIDHMLDDKSGKLAALESMDKSGANANEIAPDGDVSLFKQVSNRYFLNYSKIFERKKINPPEAAPSR